ncbi:MAG: L-serine ammonia-lyase [Spirochaetia bacterium]|nr:L-serine ammonia-lyase [Spirochaetia bacterium]
MESLRYLYRIGTGPSSSHTMGPRAAALAYLEKYPDAKECKALLFGSLAATGKGHLTDQAIRKVFADAKKPVEIIWHPDQFKPFHPNAVTFVSDQGEKTYYSVGGGRIVEEGQPMEPESSLYPAQLCSMQEILSYCDQEGLQLWEFVLHAEGADIMDYMKEVWDVMCKAVKEGLSNEGVLPGGLRLQRKAAQYHAKAQRLSGRAGRSAELISYALAVSEQNASGGQIVTAPTCGSCGVLPSILYYMKNNLRIAESRILRALLTAGLVGNLVKTNGSISGAEVGCQGEIGVACAMGGAAATQLLGGTNHQIEYAAEMGLEHHLGLTCDPMLGLVQIPCIERNAMAAMRALDISTYAQLGDGRHKVSFDNVIKVMMETGQAIPSLYRETSLAGLASLRDNVQ